MDNASQKLYADADKLNELMFLVASWLAERGNCLDLITRYTTTQMKISNSAHNQEHKDDNEDRRSSVLSIPQEYRMDYDDFKNGKSAVLRVSR